MRKGIISTAVLLIAFVLTLPAGVQATPVIVTDPTGDQIGVSTFDTFGISFTVNDYPISINIATNYPQAGLPVGGWQTLPADLLLDGSSNGVGWDYAIPLVNHGGFTAGELYQIGSLALSNEFEPAGGGYIYNKNIPVWIASGTPYLGLGGDWLWQTGSGGAAYNIVYTGANWYWDDESGADLLTLGWATATCANDPINVNPVPEPATMLLLGSGLIGLAGFGRKKLFKKA